MASINPYYDPNYNDIHIHFDLESDREEEKKIIISTNDDNYKVDYPLDFGIEEAFADFMKNHFWDV